MLLSAIVVVLTPTGLIAGWADATTCAETLAPTAPAKEPWGIGIGPDRSLVLMYMGPVQRC